MLPYGELNDPEEAFIRRISGKSGFDLNIDEVVAGCTVDIRRFRDEVIPELKGMTVPSNDVIRIIEVCRQIAVVDGALNDREVDGLGRVAQALGCEVESVIGGDRKE
ncbi:Zn-dependent protease with chaperone [Candidatus Magnetobacterium bavaricum]|uniref:Zn-dependent protease with chaperone n=1 Tax=Candidatus Magnetobacterium bavaricum TaxID=29290 RepID=A0A0F3GQ23_9BACT|nr:Zn-dependent protease with chaperone [Candidatus Magnetobacterium bavaricum]